MYYSGQDDFTDSVAFFWCADNFNESNLLLLKCYINVA